MYKLSKYSKNLKIIIENFKVQNMMKKVTPLIKQLYYAKNSKDKNPKM